ncbi:MAG: YdcF family protein [Chloroflexi bacterium]|nr:YdcF family protein [Chloroflexota bacterium]
MHTRKPNLILRIAAILAIVLISLSALTLVAVIVYARLRSYKPTNVPPARVAIVFGAGLWRDGSPTPVLQDRVATAADLYFAGKVEKLLMSGDNTTAYYNEPAAMQEYALKLGVPAEDIVLDYAGRRTYDSCYRARYIFGVTEAILVTQNFHLPRALFLCNSLGVSSTGVSADRRAYTRRSLLYWNLREVPAILVSIWEAGTSHPPLILGNPEPIFPN